MSEPISYHKKWRKYKFYIAFLACVAIILGGILIYDYQSQSYQPIPPVVPPSVSSSTLSLTSTTLVATSTQTPPVPQPILNYSFGISFGDTLSYLATAQQVDAQLDDLVSLHVGWIRLDMAWDDVQPNNSSTYNWTKLDRIVTAANARNIKILPDVAYTPAWARTATCKNNDKCAPADPEAFANFVRALVTRYSPQGISVWEIWNEPNITGFWFPNPNAQNYATLLKDSYVAIKTVEPSSTVITAGLAASSNANGNIDPTTFLSQLYADGGGPFFDAVGFHPYSYPFPPSDVKKQTGWTKIASSSPSMRSIMDANGDEAKQIWLTEYGAPTGGPGIAATTLNYQTVINPGYVSEALQAQILSDAIASVKKFPWAGPLFWYSYKDIGTANTTDENFFGIIRHDGSEKPAYSTLKALLQ